MMNHQAIMKRAVAHHQQGQLTEARELYQQVLNEDPEAADAWNLSGVIAYQTGQPEIGVQYICRAIDLQHDVPHYHLNLATALLDSGEPAAGLHATDRCLTLDENHKLAWNVRGNALFEMDRRDEAVAAFEKAIAIDRNYADAWANLGRLYRETGQYELGEQATRKALELNPGHPTAVNNLGSILRDTGRVDEAIQQFEAAMAARPQSKIAVNLGNAYAEANRLADAGAMFQQAIELDQTNANAWNSAGNYFKDLADIKNALHCFRTAHELNPKHAGAGNNYLFCLNLTDDCLREEAFQAHFEWGSQVARRDVSGFPLRDKSRDRRLKVGYISPDFRRHPLVSFVRPMLAKHDRDQFEVIAYSDCGTPDDATASIQDLVDTFRVVHRNSDETVWEMIREDEVDILVDLTGHTANDRLGVFANCAAPVQVSMLGYLNTTGLREMDYVVTDCVRDPEADDCFYTEQVVRLPSGGCCWQPPANSPEPNSLPFERNGYITFGCTHRPNKLTDQTLELWSRVLNAVPDSRLLIFHTSLATNHELQVRLIERIVGATIDVDRISMAWHENKEYLPAYHEIDILLEAIPWSSGTTALDSLWMGVPIPTIYGASPAGRPTASVLKRLELSDLVAQSPNEYVQIVSSLAEQTTRLNTLRANLRATMEATVCDAEKFTGELEAAFRNMWHGWCDGA